MQEKPQKPLGDNLGDICLPGWTDVAGGQHKEEEEGSLVMKACVILNIRISPKYLFETLI